MDSSMESVKKDDLEEESEDEDVEDEEAESEDSNSSESNSEEYEVEVDCDEDDDEEEEVEEIGDEGKEETDDEIPPHLRGNPFLKQLEQINELRELHRRVNSRLSWTKGVGENRLKKAESKVVTFLEDESVKEPSEKEPDGTSGESRQYRRMYKQNGTMETIDSDGDVNQELSSNEEDKEEDSEDDDPGDKLVWEPRNLTKSCHSRVLREQVQNFSSDNIPVDDSKDSTNHPSQTSILKRPFLRKRSGLLRFYKDEALADDEHFVQPEKRPPIKTINSNQAVPRKMRMAAKFIASGEVKKKSQANIRKKDDMYERTKNGSVPEVKSRRNLKAKPTRRRHILQDENKLQRETNDRATDVIELFRHKNKKTPVAVLSATERVDRPKPLIETVSTSQFPNQNENLKDDFYELHELKIFEKMEKLTGRPSFSSTTSLINKFVNNNLPVGLDDTHNEASSGDKQSPGAANLLYYQGEVSSKNEELKETIDDDNSCASNVIGGESRLQNSKISELIDFIVPSVSFNSLTNDLEEILESCRDVPITEEESLPPIKDANSSKNVKPEQLSVAVMMRMHEQERRQNELLHESHVMIQMREKLEKLELSLREEQKEFEKYKTNERLKWDSRRIKLQADTINMEKVAGEMDKLRQLNIDYQLKINGLNEKIENIEAEWKRKSNRWEMTNKKQQERIETLEKLNVNLEAEKVSWSTTQVLDKSSSSEFSRLQLSNPEIHQRKKIHFAEENKKSRPSSIKSKTNLAQNKAVSINPGKSTGYFPPEAEKSKESFKNGKPLRSSMKPISSSKSSLSISSPNLGDSNGNSSNPSVIRTPSLSMLGETSSSRNLWEEWVADGCKSPENGEESILKGEPAPVENMQDCKSHTFMNTDGDLETVYTNGTRKYVSDSRNFVRLIYTNGDIKETRPDGSIQYFYSELGIRQYSYPNGLEMTSYSNGQIERKNPDGTTEVLYTNGCVKFIRSDGKEEFIFPDNTVYQVDPNGERIMLFPNGQKEVHTETYKRRIYPDGTTRTIYQNNTFETVYPDSRIRLKDVDGNLISDTIEKDGVRIPFHGQQADSLAVTDSKLLPK